MGLDDRPSTGLLLSGGLDSCILLAHLLAAGERVQPFYIRGNLLWQAAELAAVRQVLAAVRNGSPAAGELVVMDLPLDDLYGDHWSVNGRDTPGAKTADEAVFLPGRNPLLVIKAALWCSMHGVPKLALAPLEANPFDDAGDAFFAPFAAALNQAVGGHAGCRPVELVRPFARLSKHEVMQLGAGLPLGLTFSCIRPVGDRHCGACNKCAERQAAFRSVDLADPTDYAHPA